MGLYVCQAIQNERYVFRLHDSKLLIKVLRTKMDMFTVCNVRFYIFALVKTIKVFLFMTLAELITNKRAKKSNQLLHQTSSTLLQFLHFAKLHQVINLSLQYIVTSFVLVEQRFILLQYIRIVTKAFSSFTQHKAAIKYDTARFASTQIIPQTSKNSNKHHTIVVL